MRVEPYGAFVEFDGHLALAHISQFPGAPARATDVVHVGQEVSIRVISVDPVRRRISLALRSVTPGVRAPAPRPVAEPPVPPTPPPAPPTSEVEAVPPLRAAPLPAVQSASPVPATQQAATAEQGHELEGNEGTAERRGDAETRGHGDSAAQPPEAPPPRVAAHQEAPVRNLQRPVPAARPAAPRAAAGRARAARRTSRAVRAAEDPTHPMAALLASLGDAALEPPPEEDETETVEMHARSPGHVPARREANAVEKPEDSQPTLQPVAEPAAADGSRRLVAVAAPEPEPEPRQGPATLETLAARFGKHQPEQARPAGDARTEASRRAREQQAALLARLRGKQADR